jgi:diguanylate cyclase (GGDEF)-like protein
MTENNTSLHTSIRGLSNRPLSSLVIPEFAWFYALWAGLAVLSELVGYTQISLGGALFLLGGICSTNFFFVTIGRNGSKTPEFLRLLACYQAIMGIAWTGAYFYFSKGSGELVLGMYLTVLMFAVFYLDTSALFKLSAAILVSYLSIFTLQMLTAPAEQRPLADAIRFLILAASAGWCYLYSKGLRDLGHESQLRNEELQDVLSRVTRVAEEDHLTKSYNRRYIMDVLSRERAFADRTGRQFSILLFDIDHFKSINDRFGHLIGDEILTDFARRVKTELRGMDTVNATDHKLSFGRYGGEEFIAVLPYSGIQGAELCADRIREGIATHAFVEDFRVTVSVGVAEYQLGETVPQLLTRADQALYQAKRDGRNLVRCSEYRAEPGSDNTAPKLRILK